jgi:hypothetical protein
VKAEHLKHQWVLGCPSGKRGFIFRAGAKDAAHQAAKTGSPGLRPYRCEDCENWHIGHKPHDVIRGEVSADEWYRKGKR